MEVFKKTVSSVFSGERRYAIPLFQRPYVWNREFQWEPLWEDIVELADREIEGPHADPPPHFLGAIVIQQRRSWGDELLTHDVIDGQQRLTTFQILLFAFRDLAAGLEKSVAPTLLAWTSNSTAIAEPEVERFKVWPTSRDIEQFKLVATAGSRAAIEVVHPAEYHRKRLQSRPRMIEAYLYFHEMIDTWLRSGDESHTGERARILRRVLDKRMQLVSIELEQTDEPQAIFETLNARGVPLLASDLLRNYIFQRAGGEAEALHKRYWTRFEVPDDPDVPDGDRFWEVEQRQGRLSRARLDLFVQHYLAMKSRAEILSGRLFPEYKAWIERGELPTIKGELEDFTRYADHFATLLKPDKSTPIWRFAERLRALDTSTAYPFVLGLLGNAILPVKELEGILVDLESFLVRRLVCGRPTKSYNRLFLQLLRDFDLAVPTRVAFRNLLAAGIGENSDWPSDEEFEKAFTTVDAYIALKAGRVEMILRAIDDAMKTAHNETITIHGKLSVEHVLPRKWETHWPLPAEIDPLLAAEQREEVVHDFGNLTLLTQPLNSTLSNGPALAKLTQISKNSSLRLNTHFQGRTTWTEEDVRNRGAELFKYAKVIWPRP